VPGVVVGACAGPSEISEVASTVELDWATVTLARLAAARRRVKACMV
jgi:hypothetical protein